MSPFQRPALRAQPAPHAHTLPASPCSCCWAPACALCSASPLGLSSPAYLVIWTPNFREFKVNSKGRGSLLSFTVHVESVKWDFSKAGSLCAEFSWSERQSTPVPPELCLTNSSGKSLGFFQALIQSFLAGFFYLNTSFAAFLFAVA